MTPTEAGFDDLQWLEPLRKRARELEEETKRIRDQCKKLSEKTKRTTLKPLPDGKRLRTMWQVAVTSAIEGQGEAYLIYTRLLYQYLTDTGPQIKLDEKITKEEYHARKHQSAS